MQRLQPVPVVAENKEESKKEALEEEVTKILDADYISPNFAKDIFDNIKRGDFLRPDLTGFSDSEPINKDAIPIGESGELLKKYITWEGFGDHHIKVYDNWLRTSACLNISTRVLSFRDNKNQDNTKYVRFENLRVLPPKYSKEGKELPLTPKFARENSITYGCDWYVDAVLHSESPTGPEIARKENISIGHVPLMLKSRNCILHGKSDRELAAMGEDPNDPGGYFIIGGAEKVVLLQEQLAVNRIFVMNMDNKGNVVTRMTASTTRGTSLIELALDRRQNQLFK